MKRVVAIAALALLSGCAAVGEGPQASSVALPSSFAYAPDPAARAALQTLLPNEDPAFQTLVAAVDADAPDLQVALARVQAARAALRAAGAERAPNISASGSASRDRSTGNNNFSFPGFDTTTSNFSLAIDASWDLDLFGQLRATQRAAALRLNAAEADARAVRLALVSDIARAAVDYRTAQARLDIVTQDLADADALVALTEARARAGLVPALDLVRAEGLEAAALAQRGPAEADLANALGRLVTLTARSGTEVAAAFAASPEPAGLHPLPQTGLPSDLLRQRPDIVAAEGRLAAANQEIAAAAAGRFPQISINAALGLAALAFGDLFSSDSLTASLGGNIAAPLLDFGRIGAQIDAREADAAEAFALYRQTVFAAIGEGETALGSLAAQRGRVAALEAQQRVEADALALSMQRYRMGLSDFLGVIDAQRQLNTTRQSLASARGAAKQAEIAVYRSFGG